jgi:hypothetical protein
MTPFTMSPLIADVQLNIHSQVPLGRARHHSENGGTSPFCPALLPGKTGFDGWLGNSRGFRRSGGRRWAISGNGQTEWLVSTAVAGAAVVQTAFAANQRVAAESQMERRALCWGGRVYMLVADGSNIHGIDRPTPCWLMPVRRG